jgi:hypothetical protein
METEKDVHQAKRRNCNNNCIKHITERESRGEGEGGRELEAAEGKGSPV